MLGGGVLSRKEIREDHAYAGIRSHLSPELVHNIEQNNILGGEQTIRKNLIQELSELEKKWGLI